MTNLAGHDMAAVLEAFHAVADDLPTCFIAYTIKGFGLPFAGHKDNHAGLMNEAQMASFQQAMAVPAGAEWERFAGLDLPAAALEDFLAAVPFAARADRQLMAQSVPVPDVLPLPQAARLSTQEGFGRILNDLAGGDSALAARIVTCSPDVTVSTNLGGWVNRRGVFDRRERADVFRDEKVISAQRWQMSPAGQHIELGIAEHNLFLLLAALGLAAPLFGARLLPIGTLYDPFINRGLDALNYACYQDARFMVVATPSGITLAPEGGAHQSIGTPLIGMAQAGLASFEPAFVDELAVLLRWGFAHLQAEEGGSVYLRLSTRPLEQPRRPIERARPRHHRRRLLAEAARTRRRARHRLLRRGGARGDGGTSGAPRGHSRRRPPGGDLGGPAPCRLARRAARRRAEPDRAAAGAARRRRGARDRDRRSSRDAFVAWRRGAAPHPSAGRRGFRPVG